MTERNNFRPFYEERTLVTGVSVMLFDQLPSSALACLMGVSCAVKHTTLKRLVYSQWYQQLMRSRYWAWVVSLAAMSGGAMIFLIFDKITAAALALSMALIDFSMTIMVGCYVRYVQLFDLPERQRLSRVIAIRIAYVIAYVSYICLSLR